MYTHTTQAQESFLVFPGTLFAPSYEIHSLFQLLEVEGSCSKRIRRRLTGIPLLRARVMTIFSLENNNNKKMGIKIRLGEKNNRITV